MDNNSYVSMVFIETCVRGWIDKVAQSLRLAGIFMARGSQAIAPAALLPNRVYIRLCRRSQNIYTCWSSCCSKYCPYLIVYCFYKRGLDFLILKIYWCIYIFRPEILTFSFCLNKLLWRYHAVYKSQLELGFNNV